MRVNCYSGSSATNLAYRYQVEAPTLEMALRVFVGRERTRPSHLRVRPGMMLAFRRGTRYFWLVFAHGREPLGLWGASEPVTKAGGRARA